MTTRGPRPELEALAKRLDLAVRIIGGQKLAAAVAGVTAQQIWRYVAAWSAPSGPVMTSLAKGANVDLNWLATGEGEPHRAIGGREIGALLRAALHYARSPTDESAISLRVAASDARVELENHFASPTPDQQGPST